MSTPFTTSSDNRPFPHPDHCQLIRFEGCDCVAVAPEDYAALFGYAQKLEADLTALRAENAALRAALEPFTKTMLTREEWRVAQQQASAALAKEATP